MRRLIPGNRFYGTLKRVGNDWMVEVEPQVMQKLRAQQEARKAMGTKEDSLGHRQGPRVARGRQGMARNREADWRQLPNRQKRTTSEQSMSCATTDVLQD